MRDEIKTAQKQADVLSRMNNYMDAATHVIASLRPEAADAAKLKLYHALRLAFSAGYLARSLPQTEASALKSRAFELAGYKETDKEPDD